MYILRYLRGEEHFDCIPGSLSIDRIDFDRSSLRLTFDVGGVAVVVSLIVPDDELIEFDLDRTAALATAAAAAAAVLAA